MRRPLESSCPKLQNELRKFSWKYYSCSERVFFGYGSNAIVARRFSGKNTLVPNAFFFGQGSKAMVARKFSVTSYIR